MPEEGQFLSLNNRRLIVEDKLKNCRAVQFFFSTISGYNAAGDRSNHFWTGFFVAYVDCDGVPGNFLFNAMHDAGLVIMGETSKKTSLVDRLSAIMKDHSNACVQVR